MSVISEFVPLKPYNTFGIDALARYFVRFRNTNELIEYLDHPVLQNLKKLVLGGGSNLLFTSDFDGVVFKNELSGIDLVYEDENHIYVKAAAGENWHRFVLHCIERDYAGIENLSLIPGSVGASPMQNIGAYGVEIKDVFHNLEAFHIHDHHIQSFDRSSCEFEYRESIFKTREKNNWVILSVTFKLNKRPTFQTSYGAIENELERMKVERITIREISKAVINIRTSKLPDPNFLGNAGSFFKNPIVNRNHFETLKEKYPDIAAYPIDENQVKLAAGWMIDNAGWKGKIFGKCGVHKNQALVIVNYGGAAGKEIYDLSANVLADIQEKYGVLLEREVNIV